MVDAGVVVALATATAMTNHWYLLDPWLAVAKTDRTEFPIEVVWWWTATGLGMAAMLVRSKLPLIALIGASLMSLLHATMCSGWLPYTPVDLAAPVAMAAVAAGTSRWVSYAALALGVGSACVPRLLEYPPPINGTWSGTWLILPAAIGVGWLVGDRNRSQHAYLAQIRQRASDLEREQDQQVQLATATERARIAREVHDVVAHGLSVIVIQAHAGASALDAPSHPTHTALAAIAATGRDSLTELRQLLGTSRPADPDLAPLPGLADLPRLVDRIRAADLDVRLTVTGDPAQLPTGVSLSAFRIVQEALTNALKHAGPKTTVALTVRCGPDAVGLTIADNGRGAPDTPDEGLGTGLRGMRERAAMLGGTLTAGNRPEGGFEVQAHLPVAARTAQLHPEAVA